MGTVGPVCAASQSRLSAVAAGKGSQVFGEEDIGCVSLWERSDGGFVGGSSNVRIRHSPGWPCPPALHGRPSLYLLDYSSHPQAAHWQIITKWISLSVVVAGLVRTPQPSVAVSMGSVAGGGECGGVAGWAGCRLLRQWLHAGPWHGWRGALAARLQPASSMVAAHTATRAHSAPLTHTNTGHRLGPRLTHSGTTDTRLLAKKEFFPPNQHQLDIDVTQKCQGHFHVRSMPNWCHCKGLCYCNGSMSNWCSSKGLTYLSIGFILRAWGYKVDNYFSYMRDVYW